MVSGPRVRRAPPGDAELPAMVESRHAHRDHRSDQWPDAPDLRSAFARRGDVARVPRACDLDHAIALANDTLYGLGSSVWTTDAAERRRLVRELAAGMTFMNAMVAPDPRLLFGGIKRSGYGREIGVLGIREFTTNAETIVGAA
jgi:succinate-semialdehyde dehydrogenase / glutarate-semialdehyde dehydrogenase